MSSATPERRITVRDLAARVSRGEPLVMLSLYDALFARLAEEGGVDFLLVGDSLGNVVGGFESTLPVTMEHMLWHVASVVRGARKSFVVADLPFLSYQVSAAQALANCGRMVQLGGAQGVKLEGASEESLRAIRTVSRNGIPVMGHIGFTPQALHAFGGFRVQGRDAEGAQRLVDEARRVEDAGAFSIVLELMPAELAARITEAVSIPTIGIGAGAGCDGQVLVIHDMLGLNDSFAPKFLRRYAGLAGTVREAVGRFAADVREGSYPSREESGG